MARITLTHAAEAFHGTLLPGEYVAWIVGPDGMVPLSEDSFPGIPELEAAAKIFVIMGFGLEIVHLEQEEIDGHGQES